jgi:hypothetical protein
MEKAASPHLLKYRSSPVALAGIKKAGDFGEEPNGKRKGLTVIRRCWLFY